MPSECFPPQPLLCSWLLSSLEVTPTLLYNKLCLLYYTQCALSQLFHRDYRNSGAERRLAKRKILVQTLHFGTLLHGGQVLNTWASGWHLKCKPQSDPVNNKGESQPTSVTQHQVAKPRTETLITEMNAKLGAVFSLPLVPIIFPICFHSLLLWSDVLMNTLNPLWLECNVYFLI